MPASLRRGCLVYAVLLWAVALLLAGADARRLLAASSVFNQNIAGANTDPNSDNIISTMVGFNGGKWAPNTGIFQIDFSFNLLTRDDTPLSPIDISSDSVGSGCDNITCFPLPQSGAIEGQTGYSCDTSSNDCHLLVVDPQNNQFWESYQTNVVNGVVDSGCAIVWSTTKEYPSDLRGNQCTSCDAAGYPISPLLFTADEVVGDGLIDHAIRLILPNSWMQRGFVNPASHGTNSPPSAASQYAPYYGMRFRLKSTFNVSSLDQGGQVVAYALQQYGMFVADGGNLPLTASSDTYSNYKYNSIGFDSHSLAPIQITDFEVVSTSSTLQSITFDCVREADTTVTGVCSTSAGGGGGGGAASRGATSWLSASNLFA